MGWLLLRVGIWFFALALVGLINPDRSNAQDKACNLALMLALDSSSSIDAAEYEFQLKGLAAALIDPEVKEAIVNQDGMILYAYEWSGRYNQEIIVGWSFLKTEADIEAFAVKLAAHQRVRDDYPTAIGYSLGYASGVFRKLRMRCARKVLDVSGDGVHNEGFSPAIAYKVFDFYDVIVNGLVIKGDNPDPESYYREHVLHGPGAFLEIANGYEAYQKAIKRKLLREIGPKNLAHLIGPPISAKY